MKSLFVLAGLVGVLWLFPKGWYTRTETGQVAQWLAEQTNAPGWSYRVIPVDKSAEKLLVADKLMNGEFFKSGRDARVVRVFGARRFKEDPKEIGLFVHTPDRCWVQAGNDVQLTTPDYVEIPVHGRVMGFERRLFRVGTQNELVYFTGLVGGQTLPYRLDHNYSVSRRAVVAGVQDRTTGANRWNDSLLWRRVFESFVSRRPLLGPKQFLRISTPVQGGDEKSADALLREMLPVWLKPEDVVSVAKSR